MSSGRRSQSTPSGRDANGDPIFDDNNASDYGETTTHEFTPAQEAAMETRMRAREVEIQARADARVRDEVDDYVRQQSPQARFGQSFATPSLGSAPASSSQTASSIFPQGTATPAVIRNGVNELSVDLKGYKQTSVDVLSNIRGCKITTNSTDNKRKIDTFLNNMRSAGLYTLVIGTRKVPICTDDNPNGYIPRVLRDRADPKSVENHDDIFHWQHDSQRTFMLCMEFFDQTLHYHCKDEISSSDGVSMYDKLMNVVNGRFLRDIERTRKALYDSFRINSSKPIAHEFDRLQTCITDYEYAQDQVMSEKQKMDILSTHLYKDPRPIIVQAYMASVTNKLTYEETKQEIINISDSLPQGTATIKMANMNIIQDNKDQKSQYCFGFQQGTCRFGDKCRFKHILNPADKTISGKKEDNAKGTKKPPEDNKKTFKKDYSNVRLTAAHQALVGPPRGKPQPMNNRGYSAKQKEQINMICALNQEIAQAPPHSPAPPPAPFSCWGTSDMHTLMTDPTPENVHIRMMRHKREADPPAEEDDRNEDEDQEYFLKPPGHTPARSIKRAKYDALVGQSPYSMRPDDTDLGPDIIKQ